MARWIRHIAAALALLMLVGFLACRFLLPERFAMNTPVLNTILGRSGPALAEGAVGDRIQVARGFAVSLYAEVPQVRVLCPTPAGDLLASVPRQGKVLLLRRDRNGDGRADGQTTLLKGLDRPYGLAFLGRWLYVAEGSAVGRIRFDPQAGRVEGSLEPVVTGLPQGGNHWTRTLHFGPDGRMYLSVGSDCNVCLEQDERRAAILRFQPDGSEPEIYARGLRNAVGFDWRPGSHELYATDNGRDLMGDDTPPDELNLVVRGGDYGWPVANGDRVLDPDVGPGNEARAAASTPPVFHFRAHNAPLGLRFLRHAPQPAGYRGAALATLHGSWNRTHKDGYKVVSLHWDAEGNIHAQDFLWGFLENEDVIGRPVDVAEAHDGAIFISDDYSGSIFRVVADASGAAPRGLDLASQGGETRGDPLATLSAEERLAGASRGAALFERFSCADCHDTQRAAKGVVAVPLRNLAARYDLPGLEGLLATPTPPMPAFPLSDAERRDLAIHLLSRFP